jgi:peptidoglycan hydrolase-like protein with peptidoglycan-binding domain
MKLKTQWAACALTLALVSTPLALAGTPRHGATAQSTAKAHDTQAMAGYRNWTVAKMTRLQKALSARGFHVKVTGRWNAATRAAVKAFQKKHGLHASGFPNQKTVKLLWSGPTKNDRMK